MEFAEIVLPFALRPLTYSVGEEPLRAGMAVMVPLGPRKLCQGIVWRVHDQKPQFATRPVEKALYGGRVLLGEQQRRFWQWVAEYYMCPLGEVMAAAIPAPLKPGGFSHEEFSREEFRPTTARYISLHPSVDSPEALDERLEKLRRKAPKQYAAMMELAAATDDIFTARVPRAALDAEPDILQTLARKELISIEDVPVLSDSPDPDTPVRLPQLTAAQQQAAEAIKTELSEKSTVLLHGATGSGKTEIFIHLAAEQLKAGRNVLYLLPEIPISWQLIARLQKVFGNRVVAYHSKFTPRQRAALFLELCDEASGARLIIGTRAAVLLPLRNLGLIVVDEEHDPSFKQDSPAPRIHARDCALLLASLHGAATLLGSATPSIESFYNATTGKYGLVTLTERYGGTPDARIVLSDSLRAAKRGERNSHFDKPLLDRLGATLEENAQAIVFRNRRGFSPYVECGACAWVAHCPDCNVTLTLHKSEGRLRCHYCGHSIPAPRLCPSCGQGELIPKGYGTEKLEEELSRIFPEARIARLDGDTTASPRATQQIIARFENGDADILVGTQMVTTGFDFGGVRMVGVVGADNLLNYPDFRASERAFQMLTQAAGRAGRREVQGEVVIQSTQTDHPVLHQVVTGDYHAMARSQLAERKAFFYPPYCRLISLTIRHKDKALATAAADALAASLRPVFGLRLLGPEPPAVERIMGEHILTLLLKIERGKSFAKAKTILATHVDRIRNHPEYKKVILVCNVDPQ